MLICDAAANTFALTLIEFVLIYAGAIPLDNTVSIISRLFNTKETSAGVPADPDVTCFSCPYLNVMVIPLITSSINVLINSIIDLYSVISVAEK